MFAIERQNNILSVINEKKSVTVSYLSKTFFISEATIRRDLTELEKKGLLKRTHGGAVLIEGLDKEIPLSIRENNNSLEKNLIAKAACSLIHDGDTIIMDSSSTVLKMIPYLNNLKDIKIITNGAKTSIELEKIKNISIYCTGGLLRRNSASYIGTYANNFIKNFYVDTLFFSCRALSVQSGLYDSCEYEAELRKTMIKNCRQSVLLCDYTKFDKKSFCHISNLNNINYLITNKNLTVEWLTMLNNSNTKAIIT